MKKVFTILVAMLPIISSFGINPINVKNTAKPAQTGKTSANGSYLMQNTLRSGNETTDPYSGPVHYFEGRVGIAIGADVVPTQQLEVKGNINIIDGTLLRNNQPFSINDITGGLKVWSGGINVFNGGIASSAGGLAGDLQKLVMAAIPSCNYLDLAKDNSNKKLPLQIKWRGEGFDKSALTLDANGHIGIGTTDAPSVLSINSTQSLKFQLNKSNACLSIQDPIYQMVFDANEIYTTGEMHIGSKDGVINLFKVNENGVVPNSVRVDVDGLLKAESIEVVSEVDADYVFEHDYNLRPLSEVESFVKENKHLPEIPSATDLSIKKQNLAKMDNLLLKKIEELTLYVIKQQKEIESLKTKLTEK